MLTRKMKRAYKSVSKGGYAIVRGDSLTKLRYLPDNSVDSIVTDPPYGIEFMGKEWDSPTKLNKSGPQSENCHSNGNAYARGKTPRYAGKKLGNKAAEGQAFQSWCGVWLREALRVLKPGGHLVAFGGTRMWHRLASAVEDAGFEIRDCLMFMHGQGFPKSMNVGKAVEKKSGTHASSKWEGWGTALKPAMEPIVLARKPFDQPTAAKNVTRHGTGALNIDGCRVGTSKNVPASVRRAKQNQSYGDLSNAKGDTSGFDPNTGRWPANVVMQHSPQCVAVEGTHACVPGCPVRMLDNQTGVLKSGKGARKGRTSKGHTASAFGKESRKVGAEMVSYPDTGGASRFFYVAKPKKKERNAGMPDGEENRHPTLKSIDLMRWLCRLVTPPGGLILDPFVGSGTTACAAVLEGFRVIGVEQDKTFGQTAEWRTAHWAKERR